MNDGSELERLLGKKADRKKLAQALYLVLVRCGNDPLPLWGGTAKKAAVLQGSTESTKALGRMCLDAGILNLVEAGSPSVVIGTAKAKELLQRTDIRELVVEQANKDEAAVSSRLSALILDIQGLERQAKALRDFGLDQAGQLQSRQDELRREVRSTADRYRRQAEDVLRTLGADAKPDSSPAADLLGLLDDLSAKYMRLGGFVPLPDLRRAVGERMKFHEFDSAVLALRDEGRIRLDVRSDSGTVDLENAVREGDRVYFYAYRR